MSVDEEYIYKYMNFEIFCSIMETKKLRMNKVVMWPDAYEMKLTKLISRGTNDFDLRNYLLKGVLSSVYAQSWTDSIESKYMWDNYAKRNGVRIKLKKERVRERIEEEAQSKYREWEEYSFPVKYPDNEFDDRYQSISSSIDVRSINSDFILSDLHHKRLKFGYEREYRYVLINRRMIDDLNKSLKEGRPWETYLVEIPEFVEYGIEYSDIEEVLIGKDCEESKRKQIIDICQKNNLQYSMSSLA